MTETPRAVGEGLFACPGCRTPLRPAESLMCASCGQRYLDADGVACFNDIGLRHGPILSRPEMATFLSLAREKGYRYALSEHLPARDPEFARYIAGRGRTAALQLIELRGDERVLDFGCAYGVLSLELVRRAAVVVALDVTREKIEFLEIVKRQAGLDTLFPICNGDPLRLPFSDGFFDWVILNAVFEYLPQSICDHDVRRAHLRALREIHRVTRPGGRLYLATKNRFSYLLILGDRDHNGLRFTSLLPRPVANWLSLKRRGEAYRIVTHGVGGYRRLLAEAGFQSATVYWPFPSLQYPERFLPLTSRRRDLLTAVSAIKRASSPKGFLWHVAARLGVLPHVIPQYTFLVRK